MTFLARGVSIQEDPVSSPGGSTLHGSWPPLAWWDDVTLLPDLRTADSPRDDLYEAMDWLLEQQDGIEAELAEVGPAKPGARSSPAAAAAARRGRARRTPPRAAPRRRRRRPATLGDPLLDVGYFLASVPEPGGPLTLTEKLGVAMLESGYPTRRELADRYAERTGASLANLDWYTALALWKLAVLYEYGRRRAVRGVGDPYYDDPALVRSFLEAAHRAAGLLPPRTTPGGLMDGFRDGLVGPGVTGPSRTVLRPVHLQAPRDGRRVHLPDLCLVTGRGRRAATGGPDYLPGFVFPATAHGSRCSFAAGVVVALRMIFWSNL